MLRAEPASPDDLAAVRSAYAHGRQLQREQGSATWPEFDDASILNEIEAGRLLRVLDGDSTAGVFSIAYADPAIWGDQERNAHIYLHRIARAAEYRGRGLVSAVLDWTLALCTRLGREGLRMDTWASNEPLIAYYLRLGFRYVERRHIAADPRLPLHYHGIELALLERQCADAHDDQFQLSIFRS